jgi:hypothetical protein
MLRVNTYKLYSLGAAMKPLVGLKEDATRGAIFLDAINAKLAVQQTLLALDFVALRICQPTAERLINALTAVIPDDLGKIMEMDRSAKLTYGEHARIKQAASELETLLSAELPATDTYYVSQKGAYSTPDLIERAEATLSPSVSARLPPAALNDMRQAGRCLAFDTPTAAGFHLLRAVEALIRQYYQVVVGTLPKPKLRNWGAYIKVLRDNNGAPHVLAVLEQIKDLHRNPLMHPETVLTTDEAIVLFGVSVSAIFAMVRDIEKRASATAATP